MDHITSFAKLLEAESAGCFNASGQFELGGGHGLPAAQLRVDEPTFSQPPQVRFCEDVSFVWILVCVFLTEIADGRIDGSQPKKVPHSMRSFAEESLATAGAPLREGGGEGEAEGPDAPQWSGGVSDRVLEGPLKKKSPAAGKGWQSRWFVLHGSNPARLSYFKRRTDDEPAGFINLELLAACFATTELKHEGKGIKMMMLDRRTYYLKASTPNDAQTWVAAVSQAAARSAAGSGAGEEDDDGEEEEADADADGQAGFLDESSDDDDEEEDLLVPTDDGAATAGDGMGEAELAALQAEEAALLEANARLQAEVAELESELQGLL